jgi:hypothetical protein
LRVPASELPGDMVHMLEELEKLAVELGQALPKIVVTCSAGFLSMKRMGRDAAAAAAVDSSELLRPPPAGGDVSSVRYDTVTGLSLTKEKNRIIDPERGTEEPGARPSEPSSVAVSISSEKSLTCIYLPEVSHLRRQLFSQHSHRPMTSFQLAPEFLSGSSTSPSPTTCTRLPQQASQYTGRRSNAHANAPSTQHSKNPNQRAASPSV